MKIFRENKTKTIPAVVTILLFLAMVIYGRGIESLWGRIVAGALMALFGGSIVRDIMVDILEIADDVPAPKLSVPKPPNFDVIKYLSHIESEADKLLSQPKEQQEIILWAGLDGLKMNADGTTEWVKKHQPQIESMCDSSHWVAPKPPGPCNIYYRGERVGNANYPQKSECKQSPLTYAEIVQMGFKYCEKLLSLNHPTLSYYNGTCFAKIPIESVSLPTALHEKGNSRFNILLDVKPLDGSVMYKWLMERTNIFAVAYPHLRESIVFRAGWDIASCSATGKALMCATTITDVGIDDSAQYVLQASSLENTTYKSFVNAEEGVFYISNGTEIMNKAATLDAQTQIQNLQFALAHQTQAQNTINLLNPMLMPACRSESLTRRL